MELPPIGPATAAPLPTLPAAEAAADEPGLRKVAEEFEATFLAEMLRYTDLNASPSLFGGGQGEDAFSSLLTQEYAKIMASDGGIGLAEQIFEALKQRNLSE